MGRVVKAAARGQERPRPGRPDGSDLPSWPEQPALKAAVIALSTAMAERIVHQEIAQDPAVLERLFYATLEAAGPLAESTLTAHPDDLASIDADRLRESGVTVVADDTVGRSGCKVATPFGEVDATLETILNRFDHVLKR